MIDGESEGNEGRWLRELAGEELQDLFSDDEGVVRAAVRRLVRDASGDEDLEDRIVDLLETSVEQSNDDTSASTWACAILGEVRSARAIEVLLRGLALEDDEPLQEAARVALLRIGSPAVEALLDALEEGVDPRLSAPGYALLGVTGIIEDEALRQRVLDFLESRIEPERRAGAGGAIEPLCRAIAFLGDRRQIGPLRRVLAEDFAGRHAGILEALEILEENADGRPIVLSTPPWEDMYGWLYEDDRDRARVRRRRGRPGLHEDPGAGRDEEERKHRSDLSYLYWGLNAFTDDDEDDSGEGYDARRFLEPPPR